MGFFHRVRALLLLCTAAVSQFLRTAARYLKSGVGRGIILLNRGALENW